MPTIERISVVASTRALRLLLLIDFALSSASGLATFFNDRLVADSLRSHAGIGDDTIPLAVVGAILLAISIACIAGLWTTTRRWARNVYTVLPVLTVMLTPIAGDIVKSGLLEMIDIINGMTTGAILLMIWMVRPAEAASERYTTLAPAQ